MFRLPITILGVLLFFINGAFGQRILRVRSDSVAGSPDGSSWGQAYSEVWKALDAVAVLNPPPSTGNPVEIWIKSGIYKPKPVGGTPRTATFSIPSYVRLLGGFAGTEASPDNRLFFADYT